MSDTATIDMGYVPYAHQKRAHEIQRTKKVFVEVLPRRSGKTVGKVMTLLTEAVRNKRTFPRPEYGYINPFLKQAKKNVWQYVLHYGMKIPGAVKNEADLFLEVPNAGGGRSRISLYGADNSESIRGGYFDGVCLDEYGDIAQDVWLSVVLPMLSDYKGWAILGGTPKGLNQFHKAYEYAVNSGNPEWGHLLMRADEIDLPHYSKIELEKMLNMQGEARFRQEYLCDFTASSNSILIPIDIISAACARAVIHESDLYGTAKVIGVDCARFGDDRTVIFKRWGRFAYEPIVYRGLDQMAIVGRLTEEMRTFSPDATFIDAAMGVGVIDRIRQLGHKITEVNFQASPGKPHYRNKRTEMWDKMKEWIAGGGKLPNNHELKTELSSSEYDFDENDKMYLNDKSEIKAKIDRSPDMADALALTFAFPVVSAYHRENSIPNIQRRRQEYVLPWHRKPQGVNN